MLVPLSDCGGNCRGCQNCSFRNRFSERIRDTDRGRQRVTDCRAGYRSSQDFKPRPNLARCTAEQILDVPVPEMVKQLVEVPETVSEDRIQQRTVEQIVGMFQFPQAVEELTEVFEGLLLRTGLNSVLSEDRPLNTPATSLVEMIVEVPVIRTQEKTQQLANTHVQLVVSAVEAEMPKIIKETVRKPIIQEKINQVTKHIEVPQL